jgi:ABC-type multidrug transport system ATPase subunit
VSRSTVSARGLVKRFGHAAALRGIDLEVPEGTTLAVLGANGAGKSTLLRIVAGLARPSTGRVEVAGHPATHHEARRQVGYVGHATLLYPSLTARENLIFAARLYGLQDPGECADRALDREGLAEVAGRLAAGFSRGMAQRLSIARGLIHDPAVVLLDEPYTGLDLASAERLARRLSELRGSHTVVWVTHDPERAARYSDAAIVLSQGRIALRAAAETLDAPSLEAALGAPDTAA